MVAKIVNCRRICSGLFQCGAGSVAAVKMPEIKSYASRKHDVLVIEGPLRFRPSNLKRGPLYLVHVNRINELRRAGFYSDICLVRQTLKKLVLKKCLTCLLIDAGSTRILDHAVALLNAALDCSFPRSWFEKSDQCYRILAA